MLDEAKIAEYQKAIDDHIKSLPTGATGPAQPPQAFVDLDTYLREFAVSQLGPTGPTGN